MIEVFTEPQIQARFGRALGRRALGVFLREAAEAIRLRGAVSILLTDDVEIRRLNREFRHKDKATDVLSFPVNPHNPTTGLYGALSRSDGSPHNPGGSFRPTTPRMRLDGAPSEPPRVAGDLAISVETAARQAEEQGHPLAAELRILGVHGLLHLAGFDHETDAGEMARKETALRRRFGLAAGLIERSGATSRANDARAKDARANRARAKNAPRAVPQSAQSRSRR